MLLKKQTPKKRNLFKGFELIKTQDNRLLI